MGWVSTSEDIEELRAEHEHFQRSTDNLIIGLRESRRLSELAAAEGALMALSERLVSVFEAKKERARHLLEEATQLLQDPAARIADKLNKRTRQRDELRVERDALQRRLQLADASRDKALLEVRDLKKELIALGNRLQAAEDSTAFSDAMQGVRPLPR